jgi:hypothetical protein
MRRLYSIISFLLLILLCTHVCAFAQIKVDYDSASPDPNTVILHADTRLALLTGYKEPTSNSTSLGGRSGVIHSGRGFRVQIYSGTDRNKASIVKADFMRRYPRIRTYMTYALPQYRIKVGDYTSRQEAQEFYRQLNVIYSPCMVVPDIVEINTFRKND